MTLKELRVKAGITQSEMSKIFEIPKRTIENWETETRKCPTYVEKLLTEKMEEIIMRRTNKVLNKAIKMNEFNNDIPELEVGEIVELGEVWDGNGDIPQDSCSYLISNSSEDGESNVQTWINYSFEIVEKKENNLETLVRVTDIELL